MRTTMWAAGEVGWTANAFSYYILRCMDELEAGTVWFNDPSRLVVSVRSSGIA
jgi:hypothetical protein